MNNYAWKLLITGLACTLAALPADEPPDSSSMERLMQQKMAVAQQAFEAVARGNFQDTSQTANRLITLSCTNCHEHIRGARTAQLDRPLSDAKQLTASRF